MKHPTMWRKSKQQELPSQYSSTMTDRAQMTKVRESSGVELNFALRTYTCTYLGLISDFKRFMPPKKLLERNKLRKSNKWKKRAAGEEEKSSNKTSPDSGGVGGRQKNDNPCSWEPAETVTESVSVSESNLDEAKSETGTYTVENEELAAEPEGDSHKDDLSLTLEPTADDLTARWVESSWAAETSAMTVSSAYVRYVAKRNCEFVTGE